MKLHRSPTSGHGFTIIELLVVITILSVLSLIALPQILGSREKATLSACAENESVMRLELEHLMSAAADNGSPTASLDAIDAIIESQQASKNPRRFSDDAFVDNDACVPFVPTPSSSCQIFLCNEGSDMIFGQQYEGGEARSFRVSLK